MSRGSSKIFCRLLRDSPAAPWVSVPLERPDQDVLPTGVVADRLPLDLDRRDSPVLDFRLRGLQRPRRVVDLGPLLSVRGVEAVALREEVLERSTLGRGGHAYAVVARLKAAAAVGLGEERARPRVDLRVPVGEPVRPARSCDGGAARRVQAEEPDARSVAHAYVGAAVELMKARHE